MCPAWKRLPGVRPLYLPAALCLLLLAGCMQGSGLFDGDPLLNSSAVRRSPAGARSSAEVALETPRVGEVPPIPPPNAPTSPAALASSTSRGGVLPSNNVGDPPPKDPRPEQPGRITPIAAAGGNQALVTSAAGTGSYEQLQAMLLARGVTMQKLETVGDRGEWRFSCAIPNPQSPNTRRTYQAQAIGASGLAAIRAVIEKIDEMQGPPR
jgi:hypothetical protein